MHYLPHPVPMFSFLLFILIAGFALQTGNRILLTTVLLLLYLILPNGIIAIRSILKIAVPLCLVIVVFMMFIYPETVTWIPVGPLAISYEGMLTGVEMISRITLLFTGIIGFFTFLPLQRLGSYLYQQNLPLWLVFILINGLKFVDRFKSKVHEVHFYQHLRGMPRSGVLKRWRSTMQLLIPLLYVLIEESSNRAIALEMRGFTSVEKRSAVYPDRQTSIDKLLTFIFLACSTVIIFSSLI